MMMIESRFWRRLRAAVQAAAQGAGRDASFAVRRRGDATMQRRFSALIPEDEIPWATVRNWKDRNRCRGERIKIVERLAAHLRPHLARSEGPFRNLQPQQLVDWLLDAVDFERQIMPCEPFDGREAELRAMKRALTTPGCVLAVVGPSGFGKTSLAGQFCKEEVNERPQAGLALKKHIDPRCWRPTLLDQLAVALGGAADADGLVELAKKHRPVVVIDNWHVAQDKDGADLAAFVARLARAGAGIILLSQQPIASVVTTDLLTLAGAASQEHLAVICAVDQWQTEFRDGGERRLLGALTWAQAPLPASVLGAVCGVSQSQANSLLQSLRRKLEGYLVAQPGETGELVWRAHERLSRPPTEELDSLALGELEKWLVGLIRRSLNVREAPEDAARAMGGLLQQGELLAWLTGCEGLVAALGLPSLLGIGEALRLRDRIALAERCFCLAADGARLQGDIDPELAALEGLSNIAGRRNASAAALSGLRGGLRRARASGNALAEASFLASIGVELAKTDVAGGSKFLDEALVILTGQGPERESPAWVKARAGALWNRAKHLTAVGQYRKAREDLEAVRAMDEAGAPDQLATDDLLLGRLAEITDGTSAAEDMCRSALARAAEARIGGRYEAPLRLDLSRALAARGEFGAALAEIEAAARSLQQPWESEAEMEFARTRAVVAQQQGRSREAFDLYLGLSRRSWPEGLPAWLVAGWAEAAIGLKRLTVAGEILDRIPEGDDEGSPCCSRDRLALLYARALHAYWSGDHKKAAAQAGALSRLSQQAEDRLYEALGQALRAFADRPRLGEMAFRPLVDAAIGDLRAHGYLAEAERWRRRCYRRTG